MYATSERQITAQQATIYIEGQDAWIASEDNFSSGIEAARAVFARHQVDLLECARAYDKMFRGNELLTEQEAVLNLIWDEADYAAFHAITVGWLSRDVDIHIAVR